MFVTTIIFINKNAFQSTTRSVYFYTVRLWFYLPVKIYRKIICWHQTRLTKRMRIQNYLTL